MRTVLTIAGSDPTGGAGLQADLKTFAACGVYGLSAVTAVTVQDTTGVHDVRALDADLVAAQIDAAAGDIGVTATKLGMLANADIVSAVAAALERHGLERVVLDPVLRASPGRELLERAAWPVLLERLLPLVDVITPNLDEAALLTGRPVTTVAEARDAAAHLVALGARGAIVTGGHLAGPPIDVCFDGKTFVEIGGERIDSRHTHGTGCTYAAALAARLALGDDLAAAAHAARAYVARAIAAAPGLGRGHGPLQHFPGVY